LLLTKIKFQGYSSTTLFKLLYVVDQEGLGELAETFNVLFILPITPELQLTVTDMLMGELKEKVKEAERTLRWKHTSPSTSDDLKRSFDKLSEEIQAKEQELKDLLKQGESVAIPVQLKKDEIGYLFNNKSRSLKTIKRLESEISVGSMMGSFYAEYASRQLCESNKWAKDAKLIINGELTKHPCVLCPRALDNLEGRCGLGGNYCKQHLIAPITRILEKEVTNGI
jgi:hypothetical protein